MKLLLTIWNRLWNSKKINRKKDAKKVFHDELLETQKQQLKMNEESEKWFQAFQSEMLEKQLQARLLKNKRIKSFSAIWLTIGHGKYNWPVTHIYQNCCFTCFKG